MHEHLFSKDPQIVYTVHTIIDCFVTKASFEHYKYDHGRPAPTVNEVPNWHVWWTHVLPTINHTMNTNCVSLPLPTTNFFSHRRQPTQIPLLWSPHSEKVRSFLVLDIPIDYPFVDFFWGGNYGMNGWILVDVWICLCCAYLELDLFGFWGVWYLCIVKKWAELG